MSGEEQERQPSPFERLGQESALRPIRLDPKVPFLSPWDSRRAFSESGRNDFSSHLSVSRTAFPRDSRQRARRAVQLGQRFAQDGTEVSTKEGKRGGQRKESQEEVPREGSQPGGLRAS